MRMQTPFKKKKKKKKEAMRACSVVLDADSHNESGRRGGMGIECAKSALKFIHNLQRAFGGV